MKQNQFLHVLDRDEAERRFRAVLDLRPLEAEAVPLEQAWQRVLAGDVVAPIDVPSFDRSNVDGFAVRAEDTYGASEDRPRRLRLLSETLAPGKVPTQSVGPGAAAGIATGGMLPRGADAVLMIEHTDALEQTGEILVRRPLSPGANVTFAGTDIGRGETVLRRGETLTSRETGVLAALGVAQVHVVRRPRVAVISTGNELLQPGRAMQPGLVFDSNATILADAVRELGGEPVPLGIVADDREALLAVLRRALAYDVVLLSGGTSKGEGDFSYRVVAELGPPGIIAHGVALKPGKPLCLAVVNRHEPVGRTFLSDHPPRPVPVAILPGFPTSAIFTFHEFVAPVIRALAGRSAEPGIIVQARLPMRINSERGRTEYVLVGLVGNVVGQDSHPVRLPGQDGNPVLRSPDLIAYPMGKGSGSVTTFSQADGFIVIGKQQEYVDADSVVEVHLLGRGVRPADLVVIGSHCVGQDYVLGRLQEAGFHCKFLAVGSTAGLEAARRGECDLAGIHLMDPKTGEYNHPFLTSELALIAGYGRQQGIVYRAADSRFEGRTVAEAVAAVLSDAECVMVNRNRGSGTRILIDRLLAGARPSGYFTEARSHNAVAAAVEQGRADWGVAILTVARDTGLGFLPLQEEHYDWVVPTARQHRPALRAFKEILLRPDVRKGLTDLGFRLD